MAAPRRMFDGDPLDWRDLQKQTAQMFSEIGCNASESFVAPLVRGQKEIDVYVEDAGVVPPQTYAIECKLWKKAVEQETIHAFRTVCADFGVTIGFVVAKNGFQSGAHEAVVRTNVRLVSFEELQDMFFDRWYASMMERLRPGMKTLFPYWDPTGGRMQTFQWGAAERERHQHLLSRYKIVLDVDNWLLGSMRGGTRPPLPVPRTFNDPRTESGTVEVSTHRQYFTLVFDAYPRFLREMQVLHGEIQS